MGEEHTETKIILVPIEAGFHGERETGEGGSEGSNVTSYGKGDVPLASCPTTPWRPKTIGNHLETNSFNRARLFDEAKPRCGFPTGSFKRLSLRESLSFFLLSYAGSSLHAAPKKYSNNFSLGRDTLPNEINNFDHAGFENISE